VGALPDSFTWSVQFSGLGSNDSAGLSFFGPPVAGQVRAAYWSQEGNGWTLQTNELGAADFAAQLAAVSRGVTLSVLNTVTNADCGQGFNATRTWQAVDDCGNAATCSQTVAVLDLGPPMVVTQARNEVVLAGQTTSLSVSVSSCPPLAYQWYFDETISVPDGTNATLVISNITPEEAGSYFVVVTNAYGSVTSTPVQLDVVEPAAILNGPTDQVATNGDTVTFNVTAQGTSPLGYQWYFNQTNSLLDQTNESLALSNIMVSQSGLYEVVVTNAYGSITSAPAQLTVFGPPFILSAPSNQAAINGATVNFNVAALGVGPLEYQWFFNSIALAGASLQNLSLSNVTPVQSGNYSVLVSNAFGPTFSGPASLRVLVLPAVSIVRTGSVVTITFSSVSNLLYDVYYKDNLAAKTWTELPKKAVLRLGTGGPMSIQDTLPNPTNRFYRVEVQ
ncbi:MAG TPA: immunoglobulin domain-containing protein, partial [Verrucomicrobiae bacterium]|nr:immunoglobulin domain-containing protein [Verrucomicrobiae bacterium]